MGQDLLNVQGWTRRKRKYYLATNSKGHMVVRGTTEKDYTHATIYGDLYNSGYCYATFTTRLDLAKRYSRRWEGSEVVEVKEITSKEARQLKKQIHEQAGYHQELQAQITSSRYNIERGAI